MPSDKMNINFSNVLVDLDVVKMNEYLIYSLSKL